jgi:transcriptional regulator with XRE-family HTH domain
VHLHSYSSLSGADRIVGAKARLTAGVVPGEVQSGEPLRSLPIMAIGDQIRAARTRLGMTQRALATRIGVDKSAVAQWEGGGGGKGIRTQNLVKVARVLQIKPSSLLGEDTDPFHIGDRIQASQHKVLVGHQLMLAREAVGLTQAKMARAYGMSPNKLNQWEHGLYYPEPLFLKSLCDDYGFTTDWFYRGVRARQQKWPLDTPATRLAFARIRAGYGSAVEFSRKHGIPQPTYALHETGGRGIRADIAKRYAEVLKNCTPEWILYGTGKSPSFTTNSPRGARQ